MRIIIFEFVIVSLLCFSLISSLANAQNQSGPENTGNSEIGKSSKGSVGTRFRTNANSTITDNETRLTWMPTPLATGYRPPHRVPITCRELPADNGVSWRIPTYIELASLLTPQPEGQCQMDSSFKITCGILPTQSMGDAAIWIDFVDGSVYTDPFYMRKMTKREPVGYLCVHGMPSTSIQSVSNRQNDTKFIEGRLNGLSLFEGIKSLETRFSGATIGLNDCKMVPTKTEQIKLHDGSVKEVSYPNVPFSIVTGCPVFNAIPKVFGGGTLGIYPNSPYRLHIFDVSSYVEELKAIGKDQVVITSPILFAEALNDEIVSLRYCLSIPEQFQMHEFISLLRQTFLKAGGSESGGTSFRFGDIELSIKGTSSEMGCTDQHRCKCVWVKSIKKSKAMDDLCDKAISDMRAVMETEKKAAQEYIERIKQEDRAARDRKLTL